MADPEEGPGVGEQLQICGDRKLFAVPPGLKCLLEELSREVLRAQPSNINEFIADYLEQKCRQRCGGQAEQYNLMNAPMNQAGDPLNTVKDGIRDAENEPRSCGGPSGEFAPDSSNTGTTPGVDPNIIARGLDPKAPFGYAPDGKTPCAPYGYSKNGLPLTSTDPLAPFGYHPLDGLPVATNDATASFGFSPSGNPLTFRDPDALLGYGVNGEPNVVPETITFCGDSIQNLGAFVKSSTELNDEDEEIEPISNLRPSTVKSDDNGLVAETEIIREKVVSNLTPKDSKGQESNLPSVNISDPTGQALLTDSRGTRPLPQESASAPSTPRVAQEIATAPSNGQKPGTQSSGQATQTVTPMTCNEARKQGENGGVMFIGGQGTSMLLSYNPTTNLAQPSTNEGTTPASGLESQVGVIDCTDAIRQAVEIMLTRVLSLMTGIMSQNPQCTPLPDSNGIIRLCRPASQNPEENSSLRQTSSPCHVRTPFPPETSCPELQNINPKFKFFDPNETQLGPTLAFDNSGQLSDHKSLPGDDAGQDNSLVGTQDEIEPNTGSISDQLRAPIEEKEMKQETKTGSQDSGSTNKISPPAPPPRQIQTDSQGKRKRCIPQELHPIVPGNFKCGTSGAALKCDELPLELRPSKIIQDSQASNKCGTIQKPQSASALLMNGGNSKCGKAPPVPPRKSDARLKNLTLTHNCATTTMGEYIEGIVARACDIMKACECVAKNPKSVTDDCIEEPSTVQTEENCEEEETMGQHLQNLAPQLAQQMDGPLSTDEQTTINLLTTVGVLLETIEETGLTQMDPIKLCSNDTLSNLADVSEKLLIGLREHLQKLSKAPPTKKSSDECLEQHRTRIRKEAHEALILGADSLQVSVGLLRDVTALCGEMKEYPGMLEKCALELALARKTEEQNKMEEVCEEKDGKEVCVQQLVDPSKTEEGTKATETREAPQNSFGIGTDPTNTAAMETATEKAKSSNVSTDPDGVDSEDGDTQTFVAPEDRKNGPDSPGGMGSGLGGRGSGTNSNSHLTQVGANTGPNGASHAGNQIGVSGHPVKLNTTVLAGKLSKSHLNDERVDFTNFPMGAAPAGKGHSDGPEQASRGRQSGGSSSRAMNPDETLAQGRNVDGTISGQNAEGPEGTLSGVNGERPVSKVEEVQGSTEGALMRTNDGGDGAGANWSGNVGQFMTSHMTSVHNLLSGQTPLSEVRGQIVFLTVSFVIGVVVGYATARSVGLFGLGRSSSRSSLFLSGPRAIEGVAARAVSHVYIQAGKCPIPDHGPGCGCVKK